jgi:hypothetical protein
VRRRAREAGNRVGVGESVSLDLRESGALEKLTPDSAERCIPLHATLQHAVP